MADAKIKFNGEEVLLGDSVTTLGRTNENDVAFPTDSNVSRYHAEIEERGGDFWLIDLDSSNGTSLNGERFKGEKKLKNGDRFALGGTSNLEFYTGEEKENQNDAATGAASTVSDGEKNEQAAVKEENEIAADAQTTSKARAPMMLGIAGAAVGLAVVCAVGAGIYSYSGSTKCEARAVIVKPDNQDTITERTEIEVETTGGECVSRAIFLINGSEFADATEQPFTATIDPKQFPELANGSLQNLQIVLEDTEGNKIIQPNEIALAFETIEIVTATPTPEEVPVSTTPTPKKTGVKVSGADTQTMAANIVKEFSGNSKYQFDSKFLEEVQKKTAEYAAEGYYQRAQAYKDVISVAFVQERNLDAPLGFILAMSRSQFKPQKNGADEGLWQMSQQFAADNGYNGLCGTESLSDAAQNCASKAASLYLKALILEVFEGDVVYSVAAFGKSPQEANIWKATLPADRSNFWNVIKDAKQREQVVKFFAAGIVAENPQKFNLKKDRPISELYKTLVGN